MRWRVSSRSSGRANRLRNSTRRSRTNRTTPRAARCSRGHAGVEAFVPAGGRVLSRLTPASTRSSTSRLRAKSSGLIEPACFGDGRLGRPVYRIVRHGVRHHELVSVDRGLEEHLACGGRRQASPKRCSRRRSAFSPLSRRLSPTTSFRATSPKRRLASKASPTNSRQSCPDRSTIICRSKKSPERRAARWLSTRLRVHAKAVEDGAASRATARWRTST